MNLDPRPRPAPIEPGPDRESVWDYPRPPRVEAVPDRLRVVVDGVTIADTVRGQRVLETSHPPAYYIPAADVREDLLMASDTVTVCEFKGHASYVTFVLGERRIADIAWTYRDPAPGFEAIRDSYAFYASRVDEAWVGGERVTPQAGDFYGGWITSRVAGPFKGDAGTLAW
jgi:uncharacterized protein (DUF427 family)